MIRIERTNKSKVVPNLLPCAIQHNGPIKVDKRHWNATTEHDETQTAYFRGRKLKGRVVKVPAKYEGVLLERASKSQPAMPVNTEQEIEEVDQYCAKTVAKFDHAVVWEHGRVPESDNVFVKGVEEWIAFAEAVSVNVED